MERWLILARILHDGSVVSLAGSLAFLVFIAEPALRAARGIAAEAPVLRRAVLRIAWASFVLMLVSGALWLVFEAGSMSGRPLAAVFARDIVGTVLFRTQFGRDWLVRLALAVVLAPALFIAGQSGTAGRSARALALPVGAALLGALAWAGHAGATPGTEGDIHLAADVLHLLAAGAWLGGLLPLALLFQGSRGAPALLEVARRATRRFSWLGIASVGTLLASGIVNSVILVGTTPGLLGTTYGQFLLLKIGGFLAMVAVAAVNRQRLTPRLLAASTALPALRQLRRNALIETALGLAILSIVGVLGTLPPGEHTQPVWPLPFRLVPGALEADGETIFAGVMVALGGAALIHAALRRRGRRIGAALGIALIAGFGWHPVAAIMEPAYPTTYFAPAVAYTAASVSEGARVFATNCAACHGAGGRGDGPAAASLPIRPADLAEAHVLGHTPGDLYWWIGNGLGGVMPGFADVLADEQRWDVVNFVRARAAAAQPTALLPKVTPSPAPGAPDFAFEQQDRQDSLRQALTRAAVLLVFYRLPESAARLQQLAAAEAPLAKAGLRLLALPADAAPPDAEGTAKLPGFAATSDPATASAYRLFDGAAWRGDCEFLIDRAGYLRARWCAGDAVPPPDAASLRGELDRMAAMPLAQQAAHVHAH